MCHIRGIDQACEVTAPQFGQVPIAQVVLEDDAAAVIDELRGFCSQQLSSYKVPVEFSKVDSLPKTPSGKIARAAHRGWAS